MTSLKKVELIVIDELGFVPLNKDAAQLMFQVISECYERKSLIITSNLEFSGWNTVLGDGTAIIINKKGVLDREAIFSFKWFIPTILKFKREFILVLIAVFTMQILGILTPVMTQVVVDKVLVHRSISTLNVLTIGIAIVYVYELILGLAKNYIFTHTTNRIVQWCKSLAIITSR